MKLFFFIFGALSVAYLLVLFVLSSKPLQPDDIVTCGIGDYNYSSTLKDCTGTVNGLDLHKE